MRLLFFLLFLFPPMLYAQDATGQATRLQKGWKANLAIGAATGQAATKPVAQVGAGYQFSSIYLGAGAGLDPYRYRTIPLFAQLRYHPGFARRLFGYGQLGYSAPALKNRQLEWWQQDNAELSGGLHNDAGLGLRLGLKGNQSLAFTLGYSVKEFSMRQEFDCWMCTPDDGRPREYFQNKYVMKRFIAKLVFELGN